MGHLFAAKALPLVLLVLPATAAAGPSSADARDFLIQKVCVDPAGRVLSLDPYVCPAKDTLRSLEPGEALPYHKYDQPVADEEGRQLRHDSYPALMKDGEEIVLNPFDRAPFGQYDDATDGYDITMIRDGWASVGGTRVGNRKGAETFFGPGCKPYGGWVFFPVSALDGHLIREGEATVPIGSDHWEADHDAWPGRCPASLNNRALTHWEPLPGFRFGGMGTTPVKTIDAIRSIHGLIDDDNFRAHGHLEIFYFTRLYGLTRWESWATKERFAAEPNLARKSDTTTKRCNGPVENTYKGAVYERIACREWTVIDVPAKPEPPPAWPVPYLN